MGDTMDEQKLDVTAQQPDAAQKTDVTPDNAKTRRRKPRYHRKKNKPTDTPKAE